MWAARGADNAVRPAEYLAEGDHCTCVRSASLPGFTRGGCCEEFCIRHLAPRRLNWIDGDRQGLFYTKDLAGDPMSVHAQHGLYGTDI